MKRTTTKLALGLALLLAVPAQADSKSAERAFIAAKAEVNKFRADEKRKKFRHHYKNLAKKLERLSAEHNESARADDFLYVAAQLREELFKASSVASDLEDAITTYLKVAERFPNGNLADDALFVAAKAVLTQQTDRARAREILVRLIAQSDKARDERAKDMVPKAKELLARLPSAAPAAATQKPEKKLSKLDKVIAKATAKVDVPGPEMEQVEVLPDPPKPGTPKRIVKFVEHKVEKRDGVATSKVTIQLSGQVGVVRGEAPATAKRARRVFFDLTPAKLVRGIIKPVVVKDGVIARVRAGQYEQQTVRVVVELEGDKEPQLAIRKKQRSSRSSSKAEELFELELFSTLTEKSPATVVLKDDLKKKKASKVAKAARLSPPPKAPSAAEVRKRLGKNGAPGGVSISQQIGLKVRRIVIDAGHGGKDTGAVGPSGTREKHVTLQIAKKVKRELKKALPGVEVFMTRDADTTLQLKDRTDFANDKRADLFLSIHANANPSRRARGIETYYLNITHDRYAMRLAQRENEEHAHGGKNISDLQFILADLAMKSNVDDSVRLGRQVQRAVVGELRENYKNVKDLGLKHALFYVLMGAKMPAILVETSFLSNRVEEKRLKSKKYQDKLAEGIVLGVKRFVAERQAFRTAPSAFAVK